MLIALIISLFVVTSWLSEDAYITFRTVDNFINGYGLTWNVAERVQSFTHPLWMLMIAGFYAVTGEIFFSVITLSILLSTMAVAILLFRVARTPRERCGQRRDIVVFESIHRLLHRRPGKPSRSLSSSLFF